MINAFRHLLSQYLIEIAVWVIPKDSNGIVLIQAVYWYLSKTIDQTQSAKKVRRK